MHIIEIILLAIGLSMDSLAVSVTGGAMMKQRYSAGNALKMAIVLGLFQAGLTAVGYLIGVGFERFITTVDHWIAFGLLLYLGGKMVYESFQHKEEEEGFDPLCLRTLCTLGVATSIDAMAVGISLAVLRSPIVLEATIIGIVTLLISAFGVFFGNQVGRRIDLKLDLIGGVILIGLGTKILIEHTVLA